MNEVMSLLPLGLAVVAVTVWLVRLEGRGNSNREAVATLRDDMNRATGLINGQMAEMRIKAEADAKQHNDTGKEIVRLQEQIKHLTDLIEKLVERPARRRTTGD